MNYIIDFKDELTTEQIDQYLVDNSMTKIKEYSFFDKVYLVSSETVPTVDDYVEMVTADDENGIELLGIDLTIVPETTATKTFNIQDNENWWKTVVLSGVDFDEETHTYLHKGKNSIVYMLDSGINLDHAEFTNANIELLHSVTGNFNDTNGHGTALTSLIVGETCGLTASTVKVVKIFEAGHTLLQSELLSAFEQVGIDYMNNGMLPSVINCSWSIPFNTFINNKIQYLLNKGIYVVASAGNSGLPVTDVTPACIPDVFTIGSFGQNLTPSNFSNYTDPSFISFTANETNYGQLDAWAPGEQIWAAMPGGNLGYIAGTSAAAAIASGAIAYNISKYVDSYNVNISEYTNYAVAKSLVEESAAFYDRNMPNVYKTTATGAKDGLLDLTEAKYSSSVNTIISYIDPRFKMESPRNLIRVLSGKVSYYGGYSRTNILKISSEISLPEFIEVFDNGILKIDAPEITESYRYQTIPLTIEYKDGTTFNQELDILIIRNDLTYSSVSTEIADDPVLTVVLATPFVCSNNGCFSDDCFTFYGPMWGCFGFNGTKTYGCNCTYGSDINLKEKITFVKNIDDIKIYDFSYKGKSKKLRGVMAQDLLETKYNLAVSKVNGYYVVNYCMLPDSVRAVCKLY